jgi:hypothetical protein
MKRTFLIMVLLGSLTFTFFGEASARGGGRGSGFRVGSFGSKGFSSRTVPVRPHIRYNGTVVKPHFRTSPNATIKDNWSTRPNINPFTGKSGTRNPFSAP